MSKTVINHLDVDYDDLPCECMVSNVSTEYALRYGEPAMIVDIMPQRLLTDAYPHTLEYERLFYALKDTYIMVAVADDGKTYDFALPVEQLL